MPKTLPARFYQATFGYFPRALQELVEVAELGASKYNDNMDPAKLIDNDLFPDEVFLNKLLGHLLKAQLHGSFNDEDRGLCHYAQVAFHALVLTERALKKAGKS